MFIAASAALLLSTSAYAADVVGNEPPAPAPVAASFDWTGAYIGVNAGGGFGKFKHPFDVSNPGGGPALANGSLNITSGGFLGGVQAGYNWQSGQMIYGVEADFQGSAVKGEGSFDVNSGGFAVSGKAGTKVDWFGTVRARIGYTPVDRFMVYGTGGLAYGHVKSYLDANLGGTPFSYSSSNTKAGWTVGLGAEYAVTNNWTLKTEYLYTDLGKSTVYDGDDLGPHINLKNDVAFHTVRVGLNYKF
jgi:outer membrane immunogenic protein